ncbi:MAG: hypothetical protein ACREFQ_21280 [Stellaceae bacterium]
MDCDSPEKCAGERRASKRGADEISRSAHRGGQVPNNFLFEPRHGGQSRGRFGSGCTSELREVQSCRPCLGQGCRRGAWESREIFNAVKVAEFGDECLRDSRFESVEIDRLKETAGQTGSEPLDWQGLQSMAVRYRRLNSLVAPGEARVGDNGVAHTICRRKCIS